MRAVFVILTLLVLTGCQTPRPKQMSVLTTPQAQQAFWQQHQQTISRLTQWQADGKIGIKHQNKGQSARWSWQHQDPHWDNITLSGPLNQGTVILTRDAKITTLTQANGQTYQSHDPHALLLKVTGWSLPINSLYYWMRGLPDPQLSKKYILNTYGVLATLHQEDWQIEYANYQLIDNHWLPQKIMIRHHNTHITLILNTWELP